MNNMNTSFHPFLAYATNCQTSSLNILPKGTCYNNAYEILDLYKNILSQPLAQQYVLPFSPGYATWIIVKENVTNEQPIFHLYYDSIKKRLLSGQKQANNIGCNFTISKQQKPKKDEFFVAKLRGNFRKTEFSVYDNGQNPNKKCTRKRKQLAYIRVKDDSIFGKSDEPTLQVIVPSVQLDKNGNQLKSLPKQLTPSESRQNLLLSGYQNGSEQVINLFQKQGDQSLSSQQVVASYFECLQEKERRVNVKFQMNNGQSSCPVLSLMSRTKNTYAMSFGYPLNMIQGFGIALALIEQAES